MAEKVGYYIVNLEVTTGLIGAPTLHLQLGVNAVTGSVQGTGEPHPGDCAAERRHPHSADQRCHPPHRLREGHAAGSSLQGEYLHSNPPSMVVYTVKVTAALAVDASWNGTGVFTNGTHVYNDCKVLNVTDSVAPRARQEHAVSSN